MRSRVHVRRVAASVICLDALAAVLSVAPHAGARLMLAYPLVWVAAVGSARGYESRLVAPGREEARRIARAALGVAVTGAALSAVIAAPLPASMVSWLVLTTATAGLSLVHRGVARFRWQGATVPRTRVVVAGRASEVRNVVAELGVSNQRHLEVVGVCVPKPRSGLGEVEVTVGLANLPVLASRQNADAVIVLPCRGFSQLAVRRLGWQLGAEGIELFVAPGLYDVDRSRTTLLATGPVSMVHVRAPELRGPRRVAADLVSRFAALLLVTVLSPLLALIALVVRLDSAGPALYRQVRIGRDGTPFVMWKFRTMEVDADERLPELIAFNEGSGPLFKIRRDPRVTSVGGWLRRYSLDELPQLFNVVEGTMTLVGPRPALPCEVAQYDADTRRRLAVKPGITGLWQVSGRSDLSWEQGTRLDLRYVDNWSLLLDLKILARTLRAVLRPTGAY